MTAAPEPPLFAATLIPHRSLDRRGLQAAAAVLGGAGAAVAGLFLALGAWPVVGFVGIEIAAVIAVLALHRRAGPREEVVLDRRVLTVRRRLGRMERRWEFPPGWLRVRLIDDEDGRPAGVEIAAHGRRLAVGRFLTAEEQASFAAALRAALAAWRAPQPAAC